MESKIKFKPNPDYRIMDQVLEVLRYYHYAYRTEQSYCAWILKYIKFYDGKTHPKDLGKNDFPVNAEGVGWEKNSANSSQREHLRAPFRNYSDVLSVVFFHH